MWSMQIDAGEQFASASDESRQGTRMRALSFAIQRLFYSAEGSAEAGQGLEGWWLAPVDAVQNSAFASALRTAMATGSATASASASLNTTVEVFSRKLRALWETVKSEREDLASLFCRCGIAPPERDVAASADGETGHPVQRAFALSLYGLAWSMATQRVAAPGLESVAEDEAAAEVSDEGDTGEAASVRSETEVADAGDAAAPAPDGARLLQTTFDAARDEIVRILYWSMDDAAKPAPASAEASAGTRSVKGHRVREKLRWLAAQLLQALLDALPEGYVRQLQPVQEVDADGRPRTRIPLVAGDSLSGRIDRFLAELPFRYTVQPLRRAPVYERAEARGQRREGHFLIELVGYRTANDWLEGFLDQAEFGGHRDLYVSAVNAQQAVPWQLNLWLCKWAMVLAQLAEPEDA